MFDSLMAEGTLKLLEYFWNNTEDNMFIVALNDNNEFYIEEINPSQAKNFNLDINTVRNTTITNLVGKEAAVIFEEKYHQCLNENRPIRVDEEVIVNGVTRFWNTMVIPMHDTKNNIKRVFGIAREFTEIINTKKEIERFNTQLEETVKVRTSELKKVNEELHSFAFKDALTQIGNRRHFFEYANVFFDLAIGNQTNISLLYLDLDYFKLINDTYGHAFGDQVLKEFATLLTSFCRETDVLSRFGGEEFVLLLPYTPKEEAIKIAQTIQNSVNEYNFLFSHKKIDITVSIGVATYEETCINIDGLIHKADKALYKAKTRGRNRFEIA